MLTQLASTHVTAPVADRAPRGAGLPVRRLETDRLTLTALRATDLDAYLCVFQDLPYEAAQAKLRDMMLSSNSHWAIRLPDERLVGVISLDRHASSDSIHNFGPTLSVYIASAFQGRGYAQEAIDGLLGKLRREDRHRVVHAMHTVDNVAAARTFINAGFLYTGRRTHEGQAQALHMIRIL